MDTWDDAVAYEDYIGRWSRPMAGRFLEWLDVSNGDTGEVGRVRVVRDPAGESASPTSDINMTSRPLPTALSP